MHSRIFRPRRNLGNIHYSESRQKSDRHQASWKKHQMQEDNRVPTVLKKNSLAPRIKYPGKPLFKCADKMTISTGIWDLWKIHPSFPICEIIWGESKKIEETKISKEESVCVCVRIQSFSAVSDSLRWYCPPGSSVLGTPQERTQVGCHVLLQGIFLTQGSSLYLLCLLHWQVGSLPRAPPGKPLKTLLIFK